MRYTLTTRTGGVDVAKSEVSADPDAAHLVTSDIDRFWHVLDSASSTTIAGPLEANYLDCGKPTRSG